MHKGRLAFVRHQYPVFDDIRIGIDDVNMPAELLKSNNLFLTHWFLVIDRYPQRIGAIDIHVLKDSDICHEIFKMLRSLDLAEFNSMYLSLASLLA